MTQHSRKDDERDLAMLQMRDEGVSIADIARAYGYTASGLRGRLSRIESAYRASVRSAAE